MVTALFAARCAVPLAGRSANARSRSRGQRLIRAAEADRTRQQDTVVDLRKEEVEKAIQTQLERSKLRKEGGGRPAADQRDVQILANETAQPASEDGDGKSDSNGAQASPQLNILEPAQSTKEDAEASSRVLAGVRERVPLMDAAAEKAGLERLLGTAGTLGLQQLDDIETASTDSTPAVEEEGEPEPVRGQWDPDQVYDDGSFLYTAETLSRDGSV